MYRIMMVRMYRIMMVRQKVKAALGRTAGSFVRKKSKGIDGLLVTVGLCIIALVLCVVMKDQLTAFITTIVANMTTKAQGILGS